MAGEKKYLSATGVDEFHYGILNAGGTGIVAAAPERVEFLQDIEVAMSSEITRAYGDNKVAELGVSHGAVGVSGNFHKIPETDKSALLGLETSSGGLLSAHGSADNPPYVAIIFAKTYEDGSTEYVGLPKGKFLKTSIKGTSKQGNTTFSQDAISAEFMDRAVAGFDKQKSVVVGADDAAATTKRDAIFLAIFGVPYPVTTTTTTEEETTTTTTGV